MKEMLKKKLREKLANSEGFTLLEILVVLTIMGFLIAMVAPKLAGISNSAVDTVCDSNQGRMIQMVSAYVERTGKFPNKLTNLVVQDGVDPVNATYYTPSASDDDPDNGQETLSSEFNDRVAPTLHILDQAELEELADMGIKRLFNLNSYDNFTTDGTNHGPDGTIPVAAEAAPMLEINLTAETVAGTLDYADALGVMMSGVGAASAADFVAGADILGYGESDFLGRIVFGFGPENSIITSGLVTNAAHCPGGLQNSDNITYNDYNLIVPRLSATADRVGALFAADAATGMSGTQYVAYGYTEDTAPGAVAPITVNADGTIDAATVPAGFKARVLTFGAQEMYQYATMCPEGHMFPADDSDFWGIDVAGGGVTIQ